MSTYSDLLARLRKKTGPINLPEIVELLEEQAFPEGTLAPGSVERSVTEELRDLGNPLTRYGAVGDGTTDITSYLDDAWAEANTEAFAASGQGRALATFELFLPPGSYRYAGAGLTMSANSSFVLRGVPGRTRLVIDADVYLISISGAYLYGRLEGIDFVGGKGVWRVTRKTNIGGSIRSQKIITDCTFCDFTEAAIVSNNGDDAGYKIFNNRFTAASASGTQCIVLPPGGLHNVHNNWFNRAECFIHARAPQGMAIKDNYFGGLADASNFHIWLDVDGYSDAGNGLTISGNYHGTENASTTKCEILCADSDTSGNASHSTAPTYEVYPHSTTASSSALRCVTVEDEKFNFGSGRTYGVARSYYERLGGWIWKNNQMRGTCPYLFEMLTTGGGALSAFATSNRYVNTNVVIYAKDHATPAAATIPRSVCNVPGFGQVYDPAGIMSDHEGVFLDGASAGSTVIDLTPGTLTAISGTTTVASASADGFGILANRQVTVNSADGRCSTALTMTNAVAGRRVWVEFEAKQGGSNPITAIELRFGSSFSTYYWSRLIELETTRRFYRFSLILPSTAATSLLFIGPTAYYSASTNVFDVSRIRVYQSPCPVIWSMPQALPFLNVTPQTAAPSSPPTDSIWMADRVTWDPLSIGSGSAYWVRWDGSAWQNVT